MPRTSSTTPTEAFHTLGLTDESTWTDAMNLAVRQKWNNLPTDTKVDDLRTRLSELTLEETPTAPMLVARGHANGDTAECAKEAARLKRNAAVNHWRSRNQLQAALDARGLVYSARRAKGGTKATVAA